jgi:hypothetical protein
MLVLRGTAERTLTKLDFGEDSIATYLYVRDDLVFDVTFDETLAGAALAALPEPGASPSGQPTSAAP